MPDMYDKLGEMLNEALETGEIPQNDKNDQVTSDKMKEESGHFSFKSEEKKAEKESEKARINVKKLKNEQITTGEVIKLHKYTYNMQYPSHIQKALTTLDIAYPFIKKDITKQYHKLLKENHPDTKKTIQKSKSVENIRQKSIDEITEAYKSLCSFFGIK